VTTFDIFYIDLKQLLIQVLLINRHIKNKNKTTKITTNPNLKFQNKRIVENQKM
jgi:hypothetical protein